MGKTGVARKDLVIKAANTLFSICVLMQVDLPQYRCS